MTASTTDLPPPPAEDRHRPSLHIHPRHGWLNDPNGICRIDGRYHVFYQHNPAGPVHEDVHWAHVSSTDLLCWSDEPIALAPRPDGPDSGGCWSGCVVVDDGTPTAVYTGARSSSQDAGVVLAYSDRALRAWTPAPAWTVDTPDDDAISDVRDPFVFTYDGHRYAVQGAGHQTGRPQLLLYGCDDLAEWVPLGPLLTEDDPTAAAVAGANIWECPNLFQLGDRWVLILSLWRDHVLSGVRYLEGDLVHAGAGLRFVARSGGTLDTGPSFYAPQILVEPDRVLLWAWAGEGAERTSEDVGRAGWSGALTLPREVRLEGDTVTLHPARELVGLRRERLGLEAGALVDAVAFEAVSRSPLRLVLIAPQGERTEVLASGLGGRLLVDGSMVEYFGPETTYTTRAYRPADHRWSLETEGPVELWRLGLGEPDS
ncbi:MAG TPA: glycoside hydrolase family 32 protein [Microlunatus sp.]